MPRTLLAATRRGYSWLPSPCLNLSWFAVNIRVKSRSSARLGGPTWQRGPWLVSPPPAASGYPSRPGRLYPQPPRTGEKLKPRGWKCRSGSVRTGLPKPGEDDSGVHDGLLPERGGEGVETNQCRNWQTTPPRQARLQERAEIATTRYVAWRYSSTFAFVVFAFCMNNQQPQAFILAMLAKCYQTRLASWKPDVTTRNLMGRFYMLGKAFLPFWVEITYSTWPGAYLQAPRADKETTRPLDTGV